MAWPAGSSEGHAGPAVSAEIWAEDAPAGKHCLFICMALSVLQMCTAQIFACMRLHRGQTHLHDIEGTQRRVGGMERTCCLEGFVYRHTAGVIIMVVQCYAAVQQLTA